MSNSYPELANMKTYIGTKVSDAKPMTRGDYNLFQGWTLPENENGADEGYIVRYADGYVSWSPKAQFDEAYRLTEGINFGLAIEALKKGLKVSRKGWNGKGMFLYYVPTNSYPAQTKAAKDTFGGMVPYQAYIAMKAADGTVVPWLASQTDMLSDDWCVIDD